MNWYSLICLIWWYIIIDCFSGKFRIEINYNPHSALLAVFELAATCPNSSSVHVNIVFLKWPSILSTQNFRSRIKETTKDRSLQLQSAWFLTRMATPYLIWIMRPTVVRQSGFLFSSMFSFFAFKFVSLPLIKIYVIYNVYCLIFPFI